MEVTALCFRLLILILLGTPVHNSYAQKSDAAFLRITPNSLQHFEYTSVTFDCEGFDGSTQLRGIKTTKVFDPDCDTKATTRSCTIERAYPSDSGQYWCETEGGERSNTVNITVTAGPVILESPVLPVKEGHKVTLSCRKKMTSSNLTADFYKDGLHIGTGSTGEMIIQSVSKSDEGLYKCRISDVGESAESWLAVRAGPVILESPALPVMEGHKVTLSCRNKKSSSNLTADFYKDGLHLGTGSTGEMIIQSVSKSDEGLYKCDISGVGESAESWLAVRGGPVILESPALPVMEGHKVTLSCRKKITSSNLTADFYKDGLHIGTRSTGEMIIQSVSKSDEGLYKCRISGVGESAESWLAVRAGPVILESPVLPVMDGHKVTLSCRKKMTSSNFTADFYKDGRLLGSSSAGEMIIQSVSKSDEGLYKCRISDVGESAESWLAVRALHRETCPSSDHFFYVLLLLRTVSTILLLPLLLLLVGLLHCGKLRVTQK